MTEPVQAGRGARRQTHVLKIWPEYFQAVLNRTKPFEIRKDDRGGFHVGDILALCEWDPVDGRYTGTGCSRTVTYVLPGGQFGLEEGYVALGISPW